MKEEELAHLNLVLTNSGFVVPANSTWELVPSNEIDKDKYVRAKYYRFKNIHELTITDNYPARNSQYAKLYLDYIALPTTEGYVKLIEAFTDVFKDLYSLNNFVIMQLDNRYLSPTGFNLALSLIEYPENLKEEILSLGVVSSFFVEEGTRDITELKNRRVRYESIRGKEHNRLNKDIARIFSDKEIGLMVFKSILLGPARS